MNECEECASSENVDEHHVSYHPEETVHLCRSCHVKVHKSESHRLKPDDSSAKTTIEIEDSTKDALKQERLPHEASYGDTLERLLGSDQSPYVTDGEVRDIVREMVLREVLA